MGLFSKLVSGLARTRGALAGGLARVLSLGRRLDESLLADLAFVKKWPAPHWRLAFQGNVHELSDADFAVAERAVVAAERSAGATSGSRR